MADALDLAIARPIAFDFNKLADPFQGYAQGQQMRADNQAQKALAGGLPRGPDGAIDFNAAVDALAKAGAPPQMIGQFAQLATSASDRHMQRDMQKQGLDLRKQEADREASLNPWQVNPAGGLQPKKGGPADPTYLEQQTEAKDKGKKLSMSDISKLSDEGGKLSQLTDLSGRWNDNYSGLGMHVPAIANAQVEISRRLPAGVIGQDRADAANWWSDYAARRNEVRHGQFGSALTATEKAAFAQSDIDPSMDKEVIKRNLKRQDDIIRGAVTRKAQSAVEAGYDGDAVAKAYGVSRDYLGIPEKKRAAPVAAAPGVTPAAAPGGAAKISTAQEYAAALSGTVFVAPDGTRRVKP